MRKPAAGAAHGATASKPTDNVRAHRQPCGASTEYDRRLRARVGRHADRGLRACRRAPGGACRGRWGVRDGLRGGQRRGRDSGAVRWRMYLFYLPRRRRRTVVRASRRPGRRRTRHPRVHAWAPAAQPPHLPDRLARGHGRHRRPHTLFSTPVVARGAEGNKHGPRQAERRRMRAGSRLVLWSRTPIAAATPARPAANASQKPKTPSAGSPHRPNPSSAPRGRANAQ